MWTLHEIRSHLENLKDKFHFKMPQMQTLLCQDGMSPIYGQLLSIKQRVKVR